ncbi:MAG: class I SAM-dependent methyltransferase [Halobacteriota archaeon]
MDRFENTGQPDWDWWGRLWPAPGELLRSLGVSSNRSLVEVGAGNGYFALPAAAIVDPATVYAVDVDASLLAELRELASLNGIDNVEAIEADARSLSTAVPERVDVALLANCFHGVESKSALVAEVHRSLRSDGTFVVVNWHDRPRERTEIAGTPRGPPTPLRMPPADTREIVLDSAPFTVSEEVDVPPYHYAIAFDRR